MVGRVLLFAVYAVLGAVASYGFVYVLTPYGLLVLGFCLFAGLALPEAGGSRWPEALGLAAGPGLFLLLIAYNSGDPAVTAAGSAIVAAVVVAYGLVGHARCAHHPSG